MDLRNVFVIIGRGFTKEMIVNEMIEEGYSHNFFFEQGQDFNILAKNIDFADEIWVFGDVTGYDSYNYSRNKGKDIWIMG